MIREIDKLAKNAFDVLIIGGGIYGIAVALETARAGLRTGLIEQTDFSHATSANSLKIIHGGLRYLQHLNIRRMRESIRSRNLMMYSAPHLVTGLGCIMPTYGHGLKGKEVMAFALLLNDLIGLDRNHAIDKRNHLPRGKIIPKDQCLKMFPNIKEDGLTGGCLWYDALALNSERLGLTFLLESIKHGALAANYVEANKLKIDDGRVIGVSAKDLLSNR
jgi:glycerol-3-phosphate dehydrogenase